MGLDQYLKAKTNNIPHKAPRGACDDLFPYAPKDNGTTEIGYWRKAYSVSTYLRETLDINDYFNLEDKEIDYDKVLSVLDYADYYLENKAYEDEYDKENWQDVVKYFTKAKEILENDPDAHIYYMEWF